MNVVLDGVTFLLAREDGRLGPSDGLYHRDARHLSELDVGFVGADVHPLHHEVRSRRRHLWRYVTSSSTVNRLAEAGNQRASDLVLAREQAVEEGVGLHERITVTNHSASRKATTLRIGFDVDFADIFEVRDLAPRRDRTVDAQVHDRTVVYRYEYRDADGDPVELTSAIGTHDRPTTLEEGSATFRLDLDPQESTMVRFSVRPGETTPLDVNSEAFATAPDGTGTTLDAEPVAGEEGGGLAGMAARSVDDLRALTTETAYGPVPVAGAPWFATVFGRDALITAYQMLPFDTRIARATLRYLAAHQGETRDDDREEEPGKIFHEIRHGELARTGRIAHTPYYGSVDSTALWIVLLCETHRWTRDDRLVNDLWDGLERAVDWLESAVDAYGDDPFLYYGSHSGLPHKAWRDTPESVQYVDGALAGPPLASVDVQGYVYDALRRAGTLVDDVEDDAERAGSYRERAETLRSAFNEAFWMPGESFYATALTEDGDPVDSVTSNVGHCLWSGIVDEGAAGDVADRLLAPDMFSGWGIRTMSDRNAGYSPISYHTGSVWPHDNALIALGLSDYGFVGAADTVADGLLDACSRLDDDAVPELFCGFDDSIDPVPYPAACSPQAWAASAPFGLIRAVCDLQPGPEDGVRIGRNSDGVDVKPIARILGIGASATVSDD